MARAPRAKISKTAGQGIDRLVYQKGYALGMTGDQPSARKGKSSHDYAKKGAKLDAGGFNVSYGDTVEPGDLGDVQALGEGAPPKGWDTGRKAAKKLKASK